MTIYCHGYNICPTANGGDNFTHHPNKEEIREQLHDMFSGENNPMFGRKHSMKSINKQKKKAIGRYTLDWFISRFGKQNGELQFQKRREMLMTRSKSCFVHKETIIPSFLGFKHKKDLGEKQRRTRQYFKNHWEEFVNLVNSKNYSQRQLSIMLNIPRSTLKVKMKQILEQTRKKEPHF